MTYPPKFRQQALALAIRQKENLTFKQTAERFGTGIATVMHRTKNPRRVMKRHKPATKIKADTTGRLKDASNIIGALPGNQLLSVGLFQDNINADVFHGGLTQDVMVK